MKKLKLLCASALLLSSIGTTFVNADEVSGNISNTNSTGLSIRSVKALNFIAISGIRHTQATFDPDTNEFVYKTTIQETSPGGFSSIEGTLTGTMVGPAGTAERHVMDAKITQGEWGSINITFKGVINRSIVNNYDYFSILVKAKSSWGGSDVAGFAVFTLPK